MDFTGCLIALKGYFDANWVTDNDEVSSTSGYVFTLGGAVIYWKSTKQTCIARSRKESEFIALDLVGQEAEWLRNLLIEIPLWEKSPTPVFLLCIRHECVRHLINNRVLSMEYMRLKRNLFDLLTK